MNLSSKIVTRKKPVNYNNYDEYLFHNEWEKVLSEINIDKFNNITIFPDQTIKNNRKIVKEIKTRSKPQNWTKTIFKNIRLKKIIIKSGIWITDKWSTNYFHWFTDTLPRLILAEKYYTNVPVIMPAYFDQYPYILESLKAFINTEILWFRNYQKFKVKELIYIPHTAPTGNYNEELIKNVANKLRKYFSLDSIKPANKILISRQLAPNRKIINYSEIKSIFKKNNVNKIVFEHLPWQAQIENAATSELLIGVHGAGLTNMLFMKSGIKVIEIRRKDNVNNNCYFSLASALGIDYYYLLCEVDDYSKITQDNNFIVSP